MVESEIENRILKESLVKNFSVLAIYAVNLFNGFLYLEYFSLILRLGLVSTENFECRLVAKYFSKLKNGLQDFFNLKFFSLPIELPLKISGIS